MIKESLTASMPEQKFSGTRRKRAFYPHSSLIFPPPHTHTHTSIDTQTISTCSYKFVVNWKLKNCLRFLKRGLLMWFCVGKWITVFKEARRPIASGFIQIGVHIKVKKRHTSFRAFIVYTYELLISFEYCHDKQKMQCVISKLDNRT